MKALGRALFAGSVLLSFTVSAQETSLTGNFNESSGRSKFNASYFSFSSAKVVAAENGFPSIFSYNYVGLNYKFAKDQKVSLRPTFEFETAGHDDRGGKKEGSASLGDLHLSYSNYSLGLLPGEWELSGQMKIYAPTSERSQEKKIYTYLKGELISEKVLRHGWKAQYTVKPAYWFHSQRSYRYIHEKQRPDGSTTREVRVSANKWGELEHYASIGKYVNSVITPKLDLGFNHEWKYVSENVDRGSASSNMLKIAPNAEIRVTRKLWFLLGIENTIELNNTRIASNGWETTEGQSIKMFQPENTQYYLMTFLSL